MHMPRSSGPGVQTVIAAQAGDAQALDRLVSSYLPLIYNIVGRALNGHADTDDVVQETMLRAVRGLPGLRDPGRVPLLAGRGGHPPDARPLPGPAGHAAPT